MSLRVWGSFVGDFGNEDYCRIGCNANVLEKPAASIYSETNDTDADLATPEETRRDGCDWNTDGIEMPAI
jgi:hypothetical protein